MENDKNVEWVDSGLLKSAYGGQAAVFCNRHGDAACMHFMRDYKCEANLYCPTDVFEKGTAEGTQIEMYDGFNHRVRVYPSGFHNYRSVFNADDLISAGIFVYEIKSLRENKKLF